MAELAGFPYFELQVNKNGNVVNAPARHKAVDFLAQDAVTDLFIMSHGWNNDMADARDLYRNFFTGVRQLLNDKTPPGLKASFAVLAVLWPSKKFTDEQLIPGGAASAASPITTAFLQKKIDGLKGVFDNPDAEKILAQARQLIPQLANSPSAQEKFANLVRSLPSTTSGNTEDASDRFFKLAGAEIMNRLAKPVMPSPTKPASGGAAHLATPSGGAAGLGSFFSGISSAALNLLNFTTYYQMKERAGLVGRTAVSDIVREISTRAPGIKLHLIGHSFGARLVTSVALGLEGQSPQRFASMTLLQAAFSHNGFAKKFDGKSDGYFRRVITEGRIAGPILVTSTSNDKAVGLAYPLASLIAGQNASSLGDANDPFGGLGRNGAQHTPEAVALTLAAVGAPNTFVAGRLHNLNADKVILDHSDICKPEVLYALLSAVAKT